MLHSAVLALGTSASSPASAFLPQHAKSRTKANLKDMLCMLSAGDLKVGGLSGTKRVLAERLCGVVDWVVEEGRDIAKDDVGAVEADASG